MAIPIRILILEDRLSDVELLLYELRRSGYEPDWCCVETETDFVAQLSEDIQVILADYTLPQFDGPSALRIVKERGMDIPFIIVTGSISEDVAVECMREGASDYLIKDRLTRLGPAVAHALQQKILRREKKQAEVALYENERLFRSLIENISDVIVILNEDSSIRYISPSVERVLGYQPEQVAGQNVFDFIHPDDCPTLQQILARDRPVERGRSVEFRARHQDGSWRVIDAFGNDLLDDPAVAGWVVVFRDLTERRRLEEQFLQSQKMEAIGRLAGGIAHDFNNLLMAIIGYSDLLLSSLGYLDPLRKDIEEIRKAGERAASLTNQLLVFSRKQVLQPEVLDLNTVVADIGNLLRRLIGEDIELDLSLGSDVGLVKIDPGQIGQVLMNLVVNARDAMPQGGRLTIETANVDLGEDDARCVNARPGRYVMLLVRDTGVGIDKETLPHIFEPFFTTKDADQGTGLGLSTVYGIIKQSDGCIWVRSEPGQGTSFEIYLPLVEEVEDGVGYAPMEVDSLRGSETVLLVEDEEMVRNMAIRVLVQHGYHVLEAQHPEDALKISGQHDGPIHLLVTDVVMPGMGGRELAGILTTWQPEMRVLFVSGYTDSAIVLQGLLDPGTAFLQKPFAPNVLLRQVRQLLDAQVV